MPLNSIFNSVFNNQPKCGHYMYKQRRHCSYKPVYNKPYCKRHLKRYGDNAAVNEEKEEVIQDSLDSCKVCLLPIASNQSYVKLNCDHQYHLKCYHIMAPFNCPDLALCPECNKDAYEVPEYGECAICLDTIVDDLFVTKCNHNFHKKCIDGWLKKSKSCPLCRQDC